MVVVVVAWVAFSVYVVAEDAWVGGFGAREVAHGTVAQTLHKLLILFHYWGTPLGLICCHQLCDLQLPV